MVARRPFRPCYPDAEAEIGDDREPPPAAPAADREVPDHRGVGVPAQPRPAVYVFPRNDLDYIGNFVNMTFEIGEGATEAEIPGAAARARDPARSSTPTTSRTPRRTPCGVWSRLDARSTRSRPSPPEYRGAVRGRYTAARTRTVLRMLDEIGTVKRVPEFIDEREGRPQIGSSDGLRPPRLQRTTTRARR